MKGSSGRQRMQFGALQPYALAPPPVAVESALGSLIEGRFSRIESAMRQPRTLAAKRDVFLPGLLSWANAVSMS